MIAITIITINLNQKADLEKTIASVVDQTMPPYEYIIIDGGSTDGSIEVIRSHESHISYWVSEPDNGLYHAMNKGILKATGDYCYFLNAGDYLVDNTILSTIIEQSLSGAIINFNAIVSLPHKQELVESPREISFYQFYTHTILHQATFFKRRLFEAYGLYNESNLVVSDWEFMIKAFFLYGESYQSIPLTIAVFDGQGVSSRPENAGRIYQERQNVLHTYFPLFLKDYRLLADVPTYAFLARIQGIPSIKRLFLFFIKGFNFILKRGKRG